MEHVTALTGARRHREWSDEERLEILREAFSPGAVVSHVARRYDISRTLIYVWRRAALRRAQAAFVPAVIDDASEPPMAAQPAPAEPEAAIVLDLTDGRRLRISASAPPALAAAALRAMR